MSTQQPPRPGIPEQAAPHRATPTVVDPIAYRYNRPGLFYLLATVIPWALWVPAGLASHGTSTAAKLTVSVLGLLGLFAPLAVVAWMTRGHADLRRDMVGVLPRSAQHHPRDRLPPRGQPHHPGHLDPPGHRSHVNRCAARLHRCRAVVGA